MAPQYRLPTLDDLTRLAEPHELALTIYVQTSPIVSERAASQVAASSAFNACLAQVRAAGARHATEATLRERWESVVDDELWSNLSSSLAMFLSEDSAEVFVLPNALENQHQVARYFDLGQLVRAVTTPQQAYALTLSTNGWKLWHATATTRAAELDPRREPPHRRGRRHQPLERQWPAAGQPARRRRRAEAAAGDVRQTGGRGRGQRAPEAGSIARGAAVPVRDGSAAGPLPSSGATAGGARAGISGRAERPPDRRADPGAADRAERRAHVGAARTDRGRPPRRPGADRPRRHRPSSGGRCRRRPRVRLPGRHHRPDRQRDAAR